MAPVDEAFTQQCRVETRKLNDGDYLIHYQVDDVNHQIIVVSLTDGARRAR